MRRTSFAALGGASLPQIGSCVRARWSYVLSAPAEVQTAYALEAVVDEAVFMLGPILVTVLATSIDPVAGLATAIVAGVAGSLAFSAQRATEPPAHPHDRTVGARPPMPWRTVIPLAVVCAALGVLFGAAEVTTVAFGEEQGSKAYAGPLLALWALGSLVAGVITGAVHWKRGPAVRVRWGALGMACAMAPLTLIGSVPLMGLMLLLGGLAIAPTLVATLSLTEQTVPCLPAHRGDGDHADRPGGRRRPRRHRQRLRRGPLRRVGGVPGQPRRGRRRRHRGADHPAGPGRRRPTD